MTRAAVLWRLAARLKAAEVCQRVRAARERRTTVNRPHDEEQS